MIIKDLKEALADVSDEVPGINDRIRANKTVVKALLSRVLLYKGTYTKNQAELQEALELALEEVEKGVHAGYTNLLTSYAEVITQQKQVELANQNYDVVQNRYQNELALLTDMVDASNMKLSAEMALVNARIGMLYNFYKLKYITNTL